MSEDAYMSLASERDRLREVLAGIVFYLGPVSSPRSGRDPADGDGVIAYSYVPALVAAAMTERDDLQADLHREREVRRIIDQALLTAVVERDRLRAVVEAVRVMWDNIVGTADEAVMGFPVTDYNAIEEALDQLDGSAEASDG
jgi:hypothetical protein